MSIRQPAPAEHNGPNSTPPPDASRRQWLQALSLAPAAVALAAQTSPAPAQAAKVKTQAQILILGSGLGGIAVASRLRQARRVPLKARVIFMATPVGRWKETG